VRYMASNHLPGGVDLEAFGRPLFAETTFDGVGFGLGFAVVDDPVKNKVLSTRGELGYVITDVADGGLTGELIEKLVSLPETVRLRVIA